MLILVTAPPRVGVSNFGYPTVVQTTIERCLEGYTGDCLEQTLTVCGTSISSGLQWLGGEVLAIGGLRRSGIKLRLTPLTPVSGHHRC